MIKKIKVAYVEDDIEAAKFIVQFLENQGFVVKHFSNATDALSFLNIEPFDILILDLNLPDLNGFEICTKIKNKINIPIIITTAHSQIEYKLRAFKLGVEDYIVKPFDLRELEARVWVALRKGPKEAEDFDSKTFEIDKEQHLILFNGNKLELTQIEFKILSILIKNKNSLVSRSMLSEELSSSTKERSLDYHIKNIRTKLQENPSNPKYLKTEYGAGYRLNF